MSFLNRKKKKEEEKKPLVETEEEKLEESLIKPMEEMKQPEKQPERPEKPKKAEKLIEIYICTKTDGETSAFASGKELIKHLQEEHGLSIGKKEDAETYKVQVTKQEAKTLIEKTKKAKKAQGKLVKIYVCTKTDGETSAFATDKELISHMHKVHDIVLVTKEETEQYAVMVTKAEAVQLIQTTKNEENEAQKQGAIASARIEARLGVDEADEPKKIVNPVTVHNAEDVFKQATRKLGSPEGGKQETFFAEEMTDDGITISCMVVVENNLETQEAIANFKKAVFKYKI